MKRMITTVITLGLLLSMGTGALAAGSMSSTQSTAARTTTQTETTLNAKKTSSKAAKLIGAAAAKAIALADAGLKASQIKDYDCDLEWERGIQIYDISFKYNGRKYEYDINAKTGAIVKKSVPKKGSGSSSTSTQSASLIGASKAKSIALKHAGLKASQIRNYECELDWERGVRVYEISFEYGRYDYDYVINAKTGKIISSERERD